MMKIRMVQLRCRYNNEKRKLEQLRANNPEATLTWRLFQPLQFLDEYIKPRKSYNMNKSIVEATVPDTQIYHQPKRRGRPPKNISYAELPDIEPVISTKSYISEVPEKEIKQEDESSSSDQAEANDQAEPNDDSYVNSVSYL